MVGAPLLVKPTSILVKPLVGYLAGLVTGVVAKSVARGAFKGTVKFGLRLKRLVREAAAEMQAAQAST